MSPGTISERPSMPHSSCPFQAGPTGAAPPAPDAELDDSWGADVGMEGLGVGVALGPAAKTGAETPSCTSVEIANAKPIDAELRLNRPNSFTMCPRTRNHL
jgi:hypothetical protein